MIDTMVRNSHFLYLRSLSFFPFLFFLRMIEKSGHAAPTFFHFIVYRSANSSSKPNTPSATPAITKLLTAPFFNAL